MDTLPEVLGAFLGIPHRSSLNPGAAAAAVRTHASLACSSPCVCTDAFADEDPFFKSEEARGLGERVKAVARGVAHRLRPPNASEAGGADPASVTMAHGDFKQANIFFRGGGGGGGGGGDPEVAVIDWQWTGPGVGATDLF